MDAGTWFAKVTVLPVVSLTDAEQALPLAEALLVGGIEAIEITLRHAAGLEGIRRLRRAGLPIQVAAGSVRNADDFARAADAGAGLMVSPGTTDALIAYASDQPLPFLPGVATPSEAMRAFDSGFATQKVFPIAALGGINTLRAWHAPLPALRFVPSGGIAPKDAAAYLIEASVLAIGVSFLTAGQPSSTELTRRARAAAGGAFSSLE
jgi:2-dehydro-3-deoxyphosphogluconate aldolase/(4S)-4-hydroxy-2-oxoglutarate aldolase